jgi:hypothetical protein
MHATYWLKPNELNDHFFKILQQTFTGKEIAVTVKEIAGPTEYLLSAEPNRARLLKALDDAKTGRPGPVMTIEEMEAMIQ